jgi:hypothetical protein
LHRAALSASPDGLRSPVWPTMAYRWRRRAGSSIPAKGLRSSRSENVMASDCKIMPSGHGRSPGRNTWWRARRPRVRSASATDHQSEGANKEPAQRTSGARASKTSRRAVTRQWRREEIAVTTGLHIAASAVRKAEARGRAGALRSHSSGRRHRESHAAACDDDGQKRRSAPMSTARSWKAWGPTLALSRGLVGPMPLLRSHQ